MVGIEIPSVGVPLGAFNVTGITCFAQDSFMAPFVEDASRLRESTLAEPCADNHRGY